MIRLRILLLLAIAQLATLYSAYALQSQYKLDLEAGNFEFIEKVKEKTKILDFSIGIKYNEFREAAKLLIGREVNADDGVVKYIYDESLNRSASFRSDPFPLVAQFGVSKDEKVRDQIEIKFTSPSTQNQSFYLSRKISVLNSEYMRKKSLSDSLTEKWGKPSIVNFRNDEENWFYFIDRAGNTLQKGSCGYPPGRTSIYHVSLLNDLVPFMQEYPKCSVLSWVRMRGGKTYGIDEDYIVDFSIEIYALDLLRESLTRNKVIVDRGIELFKNTKPEETKPKL